MAVEGKLSNIYLKLTCTLFSIQGITGNKLKRNILFFLDVQKTKVLKYFPNGTHFWGNIKIPEY